MVWHDVCCAQPGEFYSVPQKVWAFDVMIDGVGRGPPRSIGASHARVPPHTRQTDPERALTPHAACGREFTVVVTHPYTGPTEAELIAEEEAALKAEEDEALRRAEAELKAEAEARKAEIVKAASGK